MAAKHRRLGFVAVLIVIFAVLFIVNRRQKLAAETADLILVNGKIVTVDDRFPTATWIALRGDRISALGSDPKGFNRHVGSGTEIIDLGGALAIPGLIESHGHFTGLGQAKTVLDLTKARSWDDIVALVAAAAKKAKPGDWILGRGWHQEKWDRAPEPNIDGLPVHDALSKVSPENPVLLTPRQRPLVARQRQGHGAVRDHGGDGESRRRRDRPRRQGPRHRRLPRNGPEPASAIEAGHDTPEESTARTRELIELASRECLVQRRHDLPRRRRTAVHGRSLQGDGRGRAPCPSASTSCSAPEARPWPRRA